MGEDGGMGEGEGDHLADGGGALGEEGIADEGVAEEGLDASIAIHVVTEAEAAAGKYSIHDVLLPLPGNSIKLPNHAVAAVYLRVLAEWSLTMDSFDHPSRELKLPGSYRRVLEKPQRMSWRIMQYADPHKSLAPTDLTRLRGEPDPEGEVGGHLTAARLEFILRPSTYATMCLRELTKQSSELAHQLVLNAEGAAMGTADGGALAVAPDSGALAAAADQGKVAGIAGETEASHEVAEMEVHEAAEV
uniref:TRUD domain-containing protein n=1 Tax=Haptolina brevifila TaxID=156173 RepID=A0A7S2N0L4_9EUKA|mmetsp:Transcript_63429/g.125453  ORF Transcript_63429/g.125453 Transcript_63429/m.125453 type:complete len:247 (+) Transcript_63429:2-742(+)